MVKRPARTPQHTSISMGWIKELSDKLFSFYINGGFWAFCDSFMQDTFNLKEFCLRLSNKIDLPISLSPVLLGAALEGGLQLEQPQVVKIPKWPPLLPAVCLPASQVCEARRFPHFHCARVCTAAFCPLLASVHKRCGWRQEGSCTSFGCLERLCLDQPTCPLHSPTRQQPGLSQQPRPSGRWLPPGVGPTAGPWKNGHEARSKSGEACLVPDFSNTVDESILAFTFANSKNIVLFCKSPRFTNKTLAVKDIKIQPSPHSPLNVPGHVLWLHCCIFSALTGLPTQSSWGRCPSCLLGLGELVRDAGQHRAAGAAWCVGLATAVTARTAALQRGLASACGQLWAWQHSRNPTGNLSAQVEIIG